MGTLETPTKAPSYFSPDVTQAPVGQPQHPVGDTARPETLPVEVRPPVSEERHSSASVPVGAYVSPRRIPIDVFPPRTYIGTLECVLSWTIHFS